MALVGITATPLAGAARIRLSWAYPPGGGIAGVRVTRAERSYPTTPDDGVVIADGLGLTSATDAALDDGVIYYYSLFPFSGSPRVYQIDRANRATALASLSSNAAARMFALLPRVYHRYDTTLPPAPAAPADAAHGQLRRFLDLPGGQLDLFASVLAAMRNAHDPSQIDGRLLPLLAAWLGWQNDFTLELAAQRRDLRAAPSLYRTIAIVPTIEATVKRLIGAECRSKELVHNVLASNRPERLNWWARRRSAGGAWTSEDAPLSLDAAFDGRPALARAADGGRWLAYHVVDGDRSTIWLKQRAAAPGSAWTPSRPVVYRPGIDRDPTAAAQGARVWLIWSVYDRATQRWSLDGRIFTGTGGATAAPLPGDPTVERRRPAAISDATGGVWLFWMERPAALAPWVVKFSRHDGTDWEAGAPHAVAGVPAPGDAIDDDLFAMFDAPASRIRLCWTRREPIAGLGATRWRMFTRTKAALDPMVTDWTAAVPVGDTTAPSSDHDDREPFAFAGPAGTELAFSSNRDGRFAIWTLPLAGAATLTSGTTASERAPAAFVDGAETFLVFRSNRGVAYRSAVYAATETVDQRYAGGTTADPRNAAKLALRGSFDDFQTYSYDAGRNGVRRNSDWYAHDTVGLYVAPTSASAPEVLAALRRLTQGLTRFMPATERAVFVPSADLTTATAIPGLDTDQL